MAQPATNPKIEELRFRVKGDPKSRLFFPLAEELRKIDQLGEAEQVLRAGLVSHPGYLSAWVSLGRVLREETKHAEAVEALTKALQLDQGNVVAARLLAQSYYDLGEKLEAIKKYKLVRALLPADEELDRIIEKLEEELNPVILFKAPGEDTLRRSGGTPEPLDESPFASEESPSEAESVAAVTREEQIGEATAAVAGLHAASVVPPVAHSRAGDVSAPWPEDEPAGDVFAPAEAPPGPSPDNLVKTVTMANLYEQQGFGEKARDIYASILEQDPGNREVQDKLSALMPAAERNPNVMKLERWLAKVKKGEKGSVV